MTDHTVTKLVPIDLTGLFPIDKVEDITPARLRHYAAILAEQGRESPAHVVGLCAELFERVIPYCTNSGHCPMCSRDNYDLWRETCRDCGWKP